MSQEAMPLAILLRSFLDVKKRALCFLFAHFFFLRKEKVLRRWESLRLRERHEAHRKAKRSHL